MRLHFIFMNCCIKSISGNAEMHEKYYELNVSVGARLGDYSHKAGQKTLE